jgi:ElaB/YqjD/DUF883 family membrane-anchored ribosome-binding protein
LKRKNAGACQVPANERDFVMETFFSNMTATNGLKEKLVEDLGILVRDAESLVQSVGSQVAEKTRAELQTTLQRMKKGCRVVEERAMAGVHHADRVIREHPYQSLGAAFAVGLLIGALAGRSGRD